MNKGKLYLIPVPLVEGTEKLSQPEFYLELINSIDEYVVENEKTARRFLSAAGLATPQSNLVLHNYGKHYREAIDYDAVFSCIIRGKDLGLMSEAGCPGVADPGADIVAEAHRRNIQVVPVVGPSSILLALMASGFNGQKFSFHGYLPIDKADRRRKIKDLELQSSKEGMTQIFIETPFRNNQLLAELLKTAKSTTRLCVAANITAKEEVIVSKPVEEWRKVDIDLHKIPAIFLLFS